MRTHMVKQLVMIITECVPGQLAQRTILMAMKRDIVTHASQGGEAAALQYLKDEISLWNENLARHRKEKKRETFSRRTGTTLNVLTGVMMITPTVADFLTYLGYLPA